MRMPRKSCLGARPRRISASPDSSPAPESRLCPAPGLRIEIHRRAIRGLRAIDPAAAERVRSRIDALADDPYPRGSRKLQLPSLPQHAYRIRAGRYRVIYAVNERAAVVRVLAVGHRRDIYRRFRER